MDLDSHIPFLGVFVAVLPLKLKDFKEKYLLLGLYLRVKRKKKKEKKNTV